MNGIKAEQLNEIKGEVTMEEILHSFLPSGVICAFNMPFHRQCRCDDLKNKLLRKARGENKIS